MRKLHIQEKEWKYKIFGSRIIIFDPYDKKFNVNMSDFTGMTWSELEKIAWKRSWFQIKPSDVKEYIINKILQ